MFFGPHLLEADDGRCRQTRRVADEGRQHFFEVAGRDSLQVEDRDQHLKALRSPRISRQDRWRVSDALAIARSGGVEHHHDTPPYPVSPSPTSGHSSAGAPGTLKEVADSDGTSSKAGQTIAPSAAANIILRLNIAASFWPR